MYRKDSRGISAYIGYIAIDVISCELAFLFAFLLRQGGTPVTLFRGLFFSGPADFNTDLYRDFFFGIIVFTIMNDALTDRKDDPGTRSFIIEMRHAFFLSLALTLETLAFLFVFKVSVVFSRLVLFYFLILSFVIVLMLRTVVKKIRRKILGKDAYHRRHILLLVNQEETYDCIEKFRREQPDVRVSGIIFLKNVSGVREINGIDVKACGLAEIGEYLTKHWVDEIYISSSFRNDETVEKLLDITSVMGITTHRQMYFSDSHVSQKAVETLAGDTVITESLRIIDPVQLFFKRLLDIMGSLIGLEICGILMIVIVIPGILINDPGPLFYRQKRVGKNGRVFTMYKFRSMYRDADLRKHRLMNQNEMDGAMFKIKADPRVIGSGSDGSHHGYGWFIRKYSIDEFPQFLNVFLGQMSLVGTRPPTVEEWQEYEAHHRARLSVRPGITGFWQVSGRNRVSDFETVVKMDLSYINNFSIGNDFRIIAKTLRQVIKGEGE